MVKYYTIEWVISIRIVFNFEPSKIELIKVFQQILKIQKKQKRSYKELLIKIVYLVEMFSLEKDQFMSRLQQAGVPRTRPDGSRSG